MLRVPHAEFNHRQVVRRGAQQGPSESIFRLAAAPYGVGIGRWGFPGSCGSGSIPLGAALGARPASVLPNEPDLEWTLLRRPVENVTNEAYRWHVWYPLRRTAAFARLEPHDQSQILREHAQIGMAYGAQDLAHDVRLACYGLDATDSEFVIGLVGQDLHPLSHLVQAMRKTRQTSEFIEKMGPFFVGYVLQRVKGE